MIQIFGLARVGRDVEVRNTTGGDAVASVSLAFSYGRKDADGKKPTTWVDAALWGKRAEALAPYLTKGTLVAVTCEDAHIETFKKADGTEGVKLAARITAIDLAGGGEKKPAPAPTPAPRQQQRPAPAPAPAGGGFEDMADDVPF
jgi:single-strand DNA-binding protein